MLYMVQLKWRFSFQTPTATLRTVRRSVGVESIIRTGEYNVKKKNNPILVMDVGAFHVFFFSFVGKTIFLFG